MNTATIKGNWNITKGKLKQKYAQLTDDDLIYLEGQEDELLGRIQKRTARPRAEIESFLRNECDCDFAAATAVGPEPAKPARAEPNRPFGRTYLPGSGAQTGPANQRRSPSPASFKKQ